MRVLAFDTATALTAVALRDLDDAANVCLRTVVDLTAVDDPPAGGRPGHAQRLLALIQELLERSGSGWERGRSDRGRRRPRHVHGPAHRDRDRAGARGSDRTAARRRLDAGVAGAGGAGHDWRPRGRVLAVIDARRGEAFVAG